MWHTASELWVCGASLILEAEDSLGVERALIDQAAETRDIRGMCLGLFGQSLYLDGFSATLLFLPSISTGTLALSSVPEVPTSASAWRVSWKNSHKSFPAKTRSKTTFQVCIRTRVCSIFARSPIVMARTLHRKVLLASSRFDSRCQSCIKNTQPYLLNPRLRFAICRRAGDNLPTLNSSAPALALCLLKGQRSEEETARRLSPEQKSNLVLRSLAFGSNINTEEFSFVS